MEGKLERPVKLFGRDAMSSLETISRKSENGVSETVLLLKSKIPNPETPNSSHEIRIDDVYTAKLDFCPNEEEFESEGWASLVVTLYADEETEVFGKIDCGLICVSGRKVFIKKSLDHVGMATGVPARIPKIANVYILRNRLDLYLHRDSTIHWEVKISLDRNRSVELFQVYKSRFADPAFGDTVFNVGEVALHAHMEILIRHNEGFREMFYNEGKPKYFYNFPEENPRDFGHHMTYCYLQEANWLRVSHDYLNPKKKE